jgi:hypothetical protein
MNYKQLKLEFREKLGTLSNEELIKWFDNLIENIEKNDSKIWQDGAEYGFSCIPKM